MSEGLPRARVAGLSLVLLTSLLVASTVLAVPLPRADEQEPIAPSVRANSFVVIRTLGDYANSLGDGFVDALLALDADTHWIDMGSGEGVAIEHLFQVGGNEFATSFANPHHRERLNTLANVRPERRPLVSGITYHMHRYSNAVPSYGGRIRHLVGRFLENIPDAEIGSADLITDVYGVFAYTFRMDEALQKFLTALKRGGNIFLYMGVRMEETTIRVAGRSLPILDWLRTISGITVVTNNLRGIANTRVTRITKTGDPIRIPRLRHIHADQHNPPVRTFEQIEGTLVVPEQRRARGAGTAAFNARRACVAPEGYTPPRMPPVVERRLPIVLGQGNQARD